MSDTKQRSKMASIIRNARLKLGVTLDWVAYELDYKHYGLISDIENDRRLIPINRIPDFARILQIPLAELAEAVILARYGDGQGQTA